VRHHGNKGKAAALDRPSTEQLEASRLIYEVSHGRSDGQPPTAVADLSATLLGDGKPGVKDRFVVTGVPEGKAVYFAIRSFDDSSKRSAISNVATVNHQR